MARESFRRLIETGLLSLATPFLDETRLRAIVSASPALLDAYAHHRADPAATLICSPHIAYWEVQTAQPLIIPGPFPEFGTIFRPLDNATANAFIVKSRERFGMKLLSRKQGFAEGLKILRRQGMIGVLFDQNAGLQGALTTLFGRVCSTTELPGLMAEKFFARVYGIFPRRLGFWRVEIGCSILAHDNTTAGVTLALNRWLEGLLTSDDNICASWLWSHDRWRNQDIPAARFRLAAKRDLLAADLAARSLTALPRRTRIFIRLPNWLGDVVMAFAAAPRATPVPTRRRNHAHRHPRFFTAASRLARGRSSGSSTGSWVWLFPSFLASARALSGCRFTFHQLAARRSRSVPHAQPATLWPSPARSLSPLIDTHLSSPRRLQ